MTKPIDGGGLSIRRYLIPPFALLILATLGSIALVAVGASNRAVSLLVSRLGAEIAVEVERELEEYLSVPLILNELNRDRLESGAISLADIRERNRYFRDMLDAFPAASYSFVGLEDGSFYGARRNEAGGIEIIKNDAETGGDSRYYPLLPSGEPGPLAFEAKGFDCRTRPWYKAGAAASGPVFSPFYRHFVYKDLALTAALAYRDGQGRLAGVFGVDFLVGKIGEYLSSIVAARGGSVVLVERSSGLLIANSLGLPNFRVEADGAFVRLAPSQLEHPYLPAAFEALPAERDGAAPRAASMVASLPGVRPEGGRGRLRVETRVFSAANLDWLILVALPESLFTSDIEAGARTILLIVLATMGLSILGGQLIAERFLKPVRAIVRASEAIQCGDWDWSVPETPRDELGLLGEAFNTMAARIRASIAGLESAVAERTKELESSNAELEAANRTKDKFFSILAHDLKGPVGSLSFILSDLAKESSLFKPEERQAVIEELAKSAMGLKDLLENLLVWAQARRGEMPFNPVDYPADAIVAENAALFRQAAAVKGISIEAEACGAAVRCDPDMAKTLHRNLLSNAVKFTRPGGRISLSAAERGEEVVFLVRDEGEGMSPALAASLFSLESHRSTPGTAGERGTGLGLVLCKEFAERHGGRLWVESELGKGSTFGFSLPKAKA